MRPILLLFVLSIAASALFAAEETGPAVGLTLEVTYPGLSYGPLRLAHVVDLPVGTLVTADGVVVTQQQLAGRIAGGRDDEASHSKLEKNAPYLVEMMATEALLLKEAIAWAQKNETPAARQTGAALVEAYLQSVAARAQVTPDEVETYFDANQDLFGGATYDQVAKDIRAYLLTEKRDALKNAYVNSLGERTPVQFNAAWLQVHAAEQLDTPVDKARRSGKPSLVDFGASGCMACARMAPILDELGKTFQAQCNVLFVSVRDDQLVGNRYGIHLIPAQVLFDAQGKEVLRHVGFWPREQIVAKLAEMGVK